MTQISPAHTFTRVLRTTPGDHPAAKEGGREGPGSPCSFCTVVVSFSHWPAHLEGAEEQEQLATPQALSCERGGRQEKQEREG